MLRSPETLADHLEVLGKNFRPLNIIAAAAVCNTWHSAISEGAGRMVFLAREFLLGIGRKDRLPRAAPLAELGATP
jgi:hypothetical protein